MRINYNLEVLDKLTTEKLAESFNENTMPTLQMVLKKLKRKVPKKKK